MSSVRREFCEYRALTNRLWTKGISARAAGVGLDRIILKAEDGEETPAMLKNVLHGFELSRRASWSYHRLFSLTQARRQGHCEVWLIPWTTFVFIAVMVVAWWFRWSARICQCINRRGLLRRILPLRSPLRHCKNACATPELFTLASRNWTGSWPLWWRV
jgi:hypothetical protein